MPIKSRYNSIPKRRRHYLMTSFSRLTIGLFLAGFILGNFSGHLFKEHLYNSVLLLLQPEGKPKDLFPSGLFCNDKCLEILLCQFYIIHRIFPRAILFLLHDIKRCWRCLPVPFIPAAPITAFSPRLSTLHLPLRRAPL